MNINKLILESLQSLIFLFLSVCSKKNSKVPNALYLWNPGYPAYDFHAKAEILQSPKNGIKDPEVVSRIWGWEHNLQPCYVYL